MKATNLLSAGSLDYVAVGKSFYWMDAGLFFAAAGVSLRPDGTFAAVYYDTVQDALLTPLLLLTQIESDERFFTKDRRFKVLHVKAVIQRVQRGLNGFAVLDSGGGSDNGLFRDWKQFGWMLLGLLQPSFVIHTITIL